VKAAIFDLDGTLVDSLWLWDRLMDDYLLSKMLGPLRMLYILCYLQKNVV
jgi:beta-phosphoglucomutase-like phosphatase (HAD superfamily)